MLLWKGCIDEKNSYIIEYQLKASGKHDLTTVGIEIWATELLKKNWTVSDDNSYSPLQQQQLERMIVSSISFKTA